MAKHKKTSAAASATSAMVKKATTARVVSLADPTPKRSGRTRNAGGTSAAPVRGAAVTSKDDPTGFQLADAVPGKAEVILTGVGTKPTPRPGTHFSSHPPTATDELRAALDRAMEPQVDPVPWAVVTQSHRRSTLKAQLLGGGAYTVAALAQAWDVPSSTARKRIERWRDQHRVFTATHLGERVLPRFLLDDVDLEPRPELRDTIAVLREAGDDGWALWAWFASPSSWLDGAVPAVLADTEPGRVADSARRRAEAASNP